MRCTRQRKERTKAEINKVLNGLLDYYEHLRYTNNKQESKRKVLEIYKDIKEFVYYKGAYE